MILTRNYESLLSDKFNQVENTMNDDSDRSSQELDELIEGVRRGENFALEQVFNQYFPYLVAFARSRMRSRQLGGDVEGVAASAMRSFVSGAGAGRFGELKTQQDLFRLLSVIVLRKSIKYTKRDGRYIHISEAGDDSSSNGFFSIRSVPTGPVAEQALIVQETLDQLLQALGKNILQSIVLMQLEGHANPIIADTLRISIRSVQRHIRLIRQTLKKIELADNDD
ncbi:RNA polymerase sigma factor [Rosistilla oblonga]|uniref:RNA polymerase sigma factor n=2 Tax=Rosistilla oblonga TaxID=2527990 RepID=A0A518IQ20_9BACT|nr:RNA polymerase sigma factor [Rosistilla oblonga]QDV55170.1 RNA polymerase sigma factor [Rosistilla oblonga]